MIRGYSLALPAEVSTVIFSSHLSTVTYL